MMATPQDLEDFAIGFSLTEGIIPSVDAIDTIDIVEEEMGVELRIWLKAPEAAEFLGRRRKMAGPTGCGLCGVESLVEAMRPPPRVGEGRVLTRDQIMTAVDSLFPLQLLNRETRAVHAAGFWEPERRLVVVREDVGRHNALDKLAGALAREGADARSGLVVLTSRVSIEMVQKIRDDRRARAGRRVGADGLGGAHGRGLRHDAGRHCAQGWVRNFRPSAPAQGRAREPRGVSHIAAIYWLPLWRR